MKIVWRGRGRRDLPWEKAVDAYLEDCRDRNLAETTVSGYERALRSSGGAIGVWRRQEGVESVSGLTGGAVAAFRRVGRLGGLKPRAVLNGHNEITRFARWLHRHGYAVDPAACLIEPPLVPESDPDIYAPGELAVLLGAAVEPRDEIILEVLRDTGLRPSEFCQLDLVDVVDRPELAPAGPFLWVRNGKGRRSRPVPLNDDTYGLIRLYIDEVRPETTSPALFVTLIPNGQTGQPERLTYWGLRALHRRLSERTGVHAYAYRSRRTFATSELLGQRKKELIQEVMGQRSAESLRPYVRLAAVDVVRAWRRREGSA